ncbi:hypothetical protein PHYPSEUDO_008010 [Phytophthora pseudosyringae]|uniref:Uncharacterized protein n=1 Tax=Phytophthora pseudosyringae TaxID=221518 RepID=A0A8T1VFG8_9STRA|nr:hypothetical protein PHYPSEUDO_008010 [Phytophthora pseudosyringae]
MGHGDGSRNKSAALKLLCCQDRGYYRGVDDRSLCCLWMSDNGFALSRAAAVAIITAARQSFRRGGLQRDGGWLHCVHPTPAWGEPWTKAPALEQIHSLPFRCLVPLEDGIYCPRSFLARSREGYTY